MVVKKLKHLERLVLIWFLQVGKQWQRDCIRRQWTTVLGLWVTDATWLFTVDSVRKWCYGAMNGRISKSYQARCYWNKPEVQNSKIEKVGFQTDWLGRLSHVTYVVRDFSQSKKFIFAFQLDYCADKASLMNYETFETNEAKRAKTDWVRSGGRWSKTPRCVAKCADVISSGSQRKIISKRVQAVCNTHRDPEQLAKAKAGSKIKFSGSESTGGRTHTDTCVRKAC